MSILVICPSRQRPGNVSALVECWAETEATATLIVCVDDDDPTIHEYRDAVGHHELVVGPPKRLGPWLNEVAVDRCRDHDILALFGDDVRPRTKHWDQRVAEEMVPFGVLYGDDLLHGRRNPSAAFLDAEIVRRLGFMSPPDQVHLYFDNFWAELGRRLGTLTYLPDVILEHMHPHAGKADWDASYRASNNPDIYRRDSAAFDRYVRERLESDLEKLK